MFSLHSHCYDQTCVQCGLEHTEPLKYSSHQALPRISITDKCLCLYFGCNNIAGVYTDFQEQARMFYFLLKCHFGLFSVRIKIISHSVCAPFHVSSYRSLGAIIS